MEEILNITDVVAPPIIKWAFHENPTTSQKLIPFVIFVITLFIFLLKAKFVEVFNKKTPFPYHLPPGPHPWPIVGSVPEMLKNRPAYRWIHRVMKELNTEIACFRLGKTNVAAVSSPEIAREFLKKNDAVFASRPITITSGIFSHGFLTTGVTPWNKQWKKMRMVWISDVVNESNTRWLLEKRNEEVDKLIKFVYNQCSINNGGSSSSPSLLGQVVNVRTAAQHYSGSVMRKMMFSKRYFGKGREDGGPGDEEEAHVSALSSMLLYLRVSDAIDVMKKYQNGIVNQRIQQWREGKKMVAEDLLDVFISLKHENGDPMLSAEEIKAQIMEILLATVANPANAAEWALSEMLNRPQQLQKAVEELDSVVGKDRLVQDHDIHNLHYINACAREALQLHPVAPSCGTRSSIHHVHRGKAELLRRLAGVDNNCDAFARHLQGFTLSMPPGVEKIDLTEADSLLKAMPLYAHAKPRLSPTVYPAN
ncbi:hypothetical protein FNV43_RR02699 [Rhamnella rubrinervis]|uniref:Cytochrome P450 n=1 Tax=Rhamnella rubrinervis TaxID=2594499 RepID=A0A8K0HGE4_9ROSA|nr:hypothetical protein FNV43_RR02699 [Rhamnella rubrinervis]